MFTRTLVKRLPVILSILLYLFLLIRTAWVCDDAYITFRTVDNFVSGFGLTWNTAERVQTYTHPLWMFLFASVFVFTREAFFTGIFLSMAVSIAAVCIFVLRIAQGTASALLGVLVFCMSKAFIDYSTSGLENPLTHLLLALFFWVYLKSQAEFKTLLLLSVVAAMGALNRMDTILLFLPPLAYVYLKLPKLRGLCAVAIGFMPFILWELFSLFYYGFLLPNTAYAKLNTGIGAGELIERGFLYLLSCLTTDPLTLLIIATGLVVPWIRRDRLGIPVVVGMALYLIYVVRIGGDFMAGRFLTAELFCAVVLISLFRLSLMGAGGPALIIIAAIGLFSPDPSLLSGADYGRNRGSALVMTGPPEARGLFWKKPEVFMGDHGVADERAFYYAFAGLLTAGKAEGMPTIWWAARGRSARGEGRTVVVFAYVGYAGYFAGPYVHIADPLAVTDPLLARLPARVNPNWRSGHFTRVTPTGYRETLTSGKNLIQDKRLAIFYNKLTLVTRGSLLSWDRLVEVWNMNTGRYNDLIDFDYYRYPFGVQVDHSALRDIKVDGTPWDQEGNVIFPKNGLLIDLGSETHARRMEISLDSNDAYLLIYAKGRHKHAKQVIPEDTLLTPGIRPEGPRVRSVGLKTYRVDVPTEAVKMGYDEVRILPIAGDGRYSIGHIRLLE